MNKLIHCDIDKNTDNFIGHMSSSRSEEVPCFPNVMGEDYY